MDKCITRNLDCETSCFGCGTCFNVCPTDAIKMTNNLDGSFIPVVDPIKCINCGLCTKKCIALNPQYVNNKKPICYAVCADDNIRKISSSGGVFSVLAEDIINKGGYVVGAAYKPNSFEVEHIIIDSKDELYKLRGSKYIQSSVHTSFKEIKKLLNNGKTILFTGLPCNVAGLHAFLGKEYSNLITVDLICHGICSSKVFSKYYEDIHLNKKFIDIRFKDKEPWGWHPGINVFYDDESKYSKSAEHDPYFKAYLGKIAKNKACDSCTSNFLPRQGDITIGDFWGIEKFDTTLNDKKGTSVVLINNERAIKLFDSIISMFSRAVEVPLEYAIMGNRPIVKPYIRNKYASVFFENLNYYNFKELTEYCLSNNFYQSDIKLTPANLSEKEKNLFVLAKKVNYIRGNRQIVLSGDDNVLSNIFLKHFGVKVENIANLDTQNSDASETFGFSKIENLQDKYFLVICDKKENESDNQKLLNSGYKKNIDYVFLNFKPLIIDNFDCSKMVYSDFYGNTIEGKDGIIKKIIFRGFNNHIVLGKENINTNKITIDFHSNTILNIGDKCYFSDEISFDSKPFNGSSEIFIGNACYFMNSTLRVYNNINITKIMINDMSTFGFNLRIHANTGKKVIIGKDCMFSNDVLLLAGDGHSIFDVNNFNLINSIHKNANLSESNISIGNHVWVGWGAMLLAGSNIGNSSIVGAKSVVKGVCKNNCIIAGNPAKVTKTDISWARDMCTTNVNACGVENISKTNTSNLPLSGCKVLVVGGTQNMGSALVEKLLERGNDVTIATRGLKRDEFGNRVKRKVIDVEDSLSTKIELAGEYYDVVYHNLAYSSISVQNILDNIKCKKYVQLSSIAVYDNIGIKTMEDNYNPYYENYQILPKDIFYGRGKKYAECILMQNYFNINSIIVRIPYVIPTDRLIFYCKNIFEGTKMKIRNLNRSVSFVRSCDVGDFLTWISNQEFYGCINFSSIGVVKIVDIIAYIEKKMNKSAIIDNEEGLEGPFHDSNNNDFSLDLSKVEKLQYQNNNIDAWFWYELDNCIRKILNK